MAGPIKHVGKIETNNAKVVVAFRTIPNEPESALVVPTSPLSQSYHDELFKIVDDTRGQQAFELATVLSVSKFSDGANMLSALDRIGALQKVATKDVIMTPTNKTESHIRLSDLNQVIAEQKGVTVADLAVKPAGDTAEVETVATANEIVAPSDTDVLSDEDLAKQYRDQADSLYKEVQELRKKADELAPKKTARKKSKTDA